MRLAVALWVAIVACDGGGSITPDAGVDAEVTTDAHTDYAIAIAPTSLTLPVGSAGTVDVTVTRTNHSEAITLAAGTVPAGVTVTFDPPTLAPGRALFTRSCGRRRHRVDPIRSCMGRRWRR